MSTVPGPSRDPTTEIGPYRLLDVLGEGGMGIVHAAEQRFPFHRRVALKVIKIGMDTKEVLARFDAERQALALLDHPNIAKVLDAGATAEGRPYFAMELVRGLSITRYCDEVRLSIRERVELVVQACAALQHAHDRGILHRDVKPSNLLVTEVDGKPMVKVIDFGLAKATNQRLTERTLFTEEGRIIGTPEYMSPEQAETSAQDVDRRTDVFSLGVVLYELIAGALPFDFKVARAKGYLEVQRWIREEEPPTPRRRLGGLGDVLDVILAARRCRLRELAQSLEDGLDAVIMRAIAKQRRDRYASCAEFAADLRRFLAKEPVSARPVGLLVGLGRRLRWLRRRHPASLALVFGCVATLATVLLVPWPVATQAGSVAEPVAAVAPTVSRYAEGYRRLHGLFIGAGRAGSSRVPLAGPRREMQSIVDALRTAEPGWARPGAIRTLFDEEATARAIASEFKRLSRDADAEDAVLVCFSGYSSLQRNKGAFDLLCSDPEDGGNLKREELLLFLDACKAKHILCILDCADAAAVIGSDAKYWETDLAPNVAQIATSRRAGDRTMVASREILCSSNIGESVGSATPDALSPFCELLVAHLRALASDQAGAVHTQEVADALRRRAVRTRRPDPDPAAADTFGGARPVYLRQKGKDGSFAFRSGVRLR